MSTNSANLPQPAAPARPDPALRASRRLWLLVAVAALLLFIPGAQAYYRALLANPFFGSPGSVAFPWKDAGELTLAFGQLGLSLSQYAWLTIARQVVVGLGCLVIAGLIALRATDRGALLIAVLLVIAGTVGGSNTAALIHLGPRWWLLGTALNVLSAASIFTLVYVFPDGRFAPRWFRWVWLISTVLNVAFTFASAVLSDWLPRSPLLQIMVVLFIAAQLIFVLAAPIYRYRRDASPAQRQQLKWVLLALSAQAVIWPVGAFAIPAVFPATTHTLAGALAYNLLRQTLQDFGFLLIPITIGLAILRYRLYDIDVIIRRTLIYAVLTALLALAYFGSVVVLQNVFGAFTGQRQSPLVTVLSTLIIAALFVPLRRRVQSVIDRRFFRNKYDAVRTLAAFGVQVRDETDLATLTERMLDVVDETMQPAGVTLWLKK